MKENVLDLRKKQKLIVDALEEVKGRDIVVFDTARLPTVFERVIVASGDSSRQVRALADRVQEHLRAAGLRVSGVEGGRETDWVLVDAGEIVVHVMHPTAREYYNLEELWGAKPVRLRAPVRRAPTRRKPAGRKPAARTPARPAARRAPRKRTVKKKART